MKHYALLNIVTLCFLSLVGCTGGSTGGNTPPGSSSQSGNNSGPPGEFSGGNPGDEGYGGAGSGYGFGGTGEDKAKLASIHIKFRDTVIALSKETNTTFLGTGLNLNLAQAALVRRWILCTLDQLIQHNVSNPPTEVLAAEVLPPGFEGRTRISKYGEIAILLESLRKKDEKAVFQILAHEFFHKVECDGHFLNDDSPFLDFDTPSGSRRLIDAAASALQRYAYDRVYMKSVLDSRPILYARLGEKGGSVAYDISGFNRHGVYEGTLDYNIPGALTNGEDGSLQFNKIEPGRLKFSSIPIRNPGGGVNTVEFWMRGENGINKPGSTNFEDVFSSGESFIFALANLGLGNIIGSYLTGLYGVYQSSLPSGWLHIVLVVNQASPANFGFYINNALRDKTLRSSYEVDSDNYLSTQFTFGPRSLAIDNPRFFGAVDEIAIYDRALTPTEIKQHYEIATQPNP